MTTFLWSLFSFVIAIALLITIHEYGHFIVARLLKVKVLRFSIGFGKALYKKNTKSGMEFVIGAFPLGGYVKMLDEREGPVKEEEKIFAFNRQTLWKRFLIVLAGPFFNFFLAIFLFWSIYILGIPTLKPLIGEIIPNTPAASAHMESKEIITQINGKKTLSWEGVGLELLSNIGNKKLVHINTQEEDNAIQHEYALSLSEIDSSSKDFDVLSVVGVIPYVPKIPATVGKVQAKSPAETAGIEEGDIFVSINNQTVANWGELLDYISARPDETVTVKLLRGKNIQTITLHTDSYRDEEGKVQGRIGVFSKTISWPKELVWVEQYGFFEAIVPAVKRTWDMTLLSYKLLGKMITGKISAKNVQGPIAIAEGAGFYAQLGLVPFLSFLALISLSLGAINLLPIPVLDGGHILFFFCEGILRKPLSEKAQEIGVRMGLILIIGVMLFAFYNDILRLLTQ